MLDVLPPARRRVRHRRLPARAADDRAVKFARESDGHTTAQLEFTEEHFADARDATNTVLPPLRDIDLTDRINGHFSFTPDGYPMLGESSRVRGLWLAEGIWVTHAGGSAKAVVDLLTTGRSEIDLRQAHPDRFHPFATTDAYVKLAARSSTARCTTSSTRCSSCCIPADCAPRPTISGSKRPAPS